MFRHGIFLKERYSSSAIFYPENFKFEEDGTICSLHFGSVTVVNVHLALGSNNVKVRADLIQNIMPRYVPVTGYKILMGELRSQRRECTRETG